jgi:hypothetical protein
MHAAILAISSPPPLAFAVWLGGAALSVCGLFVVNYFSFKAFSITDEDMTELLDPNKQYIDIPLLAVALITPIVSACWAALLFAIGIFDYLVHNDGVGWRYRVIAFIPVGAGLIAVLMTVALGERLVQKVEAKVCRPSKIPRISSHLTMPY